MSRQVRCRVPPGSAVHEGRSWGRVNRVVVYEKTSCKPAYGNVTSVGSIYGTPLRVCTGRIKGVCPPEICDCPNEVCLQPGDKKKEVIKTSVKLAFVLAIIYWTWLQGIWSDPEGTAQLTWDSYAWARDFFGTKNKIERSGEQIYDMRRIKYNLRTVWNDMQLALNSLIHATPPMFWELGNKILPRRPVDPKAQKAKLEES